MAKIGRKLSELELLEGGGGSGMMGGGGGRNPFTRPPAEKEFNKPPKQEYTLSPQEREAMVAYKIKKPQKDEGKKALEDVQLGLGAAGVAAGVAAATDTQRKSTPEQRSNRKEKADRKDIPSFAETPSGYKKGGSVSSRADGIAQRGKTKGRMC